MEWIRAAEAAKRLGVSEEEVVRRIDEYELPGLWENDGWLVRTDSLESRVESLESRVNGGGAHYEDEDEDDRKRQAARKLPAARKKWLPAAKKNWPKPVRFSAGVPLIPFDEAVARLNVHKYHLNRIIKEGRIGCEEDADGSRW